MTELVFVTQVLDPEDPVLGFVVPWIGALARRASALTIVANEVRVRPDFGARVEVVSLEKERGAGRAARILRYQRTLARVGQGSRPVILAHMCPSYLVAAAPVLRARRLRSMLWFAHPSVTPTLVAAEAIADVVLTSLPGAYPRRTPKVRAIGQAIDVVGLAFEPRAPSADGLRLLGLGRTSPSKGFDRLVRSVGKVRADGLDASLRIVGPSTTPLEHRHLVELRRLVDELDVRDAVSFTGGVRPDQVPGVIRESSTLLNAMVSGSGDKVVFEAMALGRLVLVANPAFAPLIAGLPLDLSFDRTEVSDLAGAIRRLAEAGSEAVIETLHELRLRVEHGHSLEGWADRVMGLAGATR
jgi:glycosyltransferase involved in cell wall biosynthesis